MGASESGEGGAGWDETQPVLDDEHLESILHNERNTALPNNYEPLKFFSRV